MGLSASASLAIHSMELGPSIYGEAGIPSQPLRAKPESTPDEDHNTDDPHVLTDKGAAMLHALRRVLLRRWRFCLPCASSAAAECAWVL